MFKDVPKCPRLTASWQISGIASLLCNAVHLNTPRCCKVLWKMRFLVWKKEMDWQFVVGNASLHDEWDWIGSKVLQLHGGCATKHGCTSLRKAQNRRRGRGKGVEQPMIKRDLQISIFFVMMKFRTHSLEFIGTLRLYAIILWTKKHSVLILIMSIKRQVLGDKQVYYL